MLKLSKFDAYTAQKLAQLEEKIAQARLQCLLLFASLDGDDHDDGGDGVKHNELIQRWTDRVEQESNLRNCLHVINGMSISSLYYMNIL